MLVYLRGRKRSKRVRVKPLKPKAEDEPVALA